MNDRGLGRIFGNDLLISKHTEVSPAAEPPGSADYLPNCQPRRAARRHRRSGCWARIPTWWKISIAALLVTGAAMGTGRSHVLVLSVLLLAAVFNMLVGTAEARWRLYAWRTPEAQQDGGWPAAVEAHDSRLTFSLIVAARDEAAVIGETLRFLVKQDHPRFEIIVSLCADDRSTIAATRAVADEYPHLISVVVSHYDNPSKARQLNTALSRCSGAVVGVVDAEDDVASALLLHVEALFSRSGAHIVQGGVQLMNLGTGPSTWFQVHNVLEYYFWYTSRMSYQADVGFVPLGGNTVFIYRALLERAGGWPLSLTEDCALGVRLSAAYQIRVATAYSADLCTREEAPPTIFNRDLGSLFWQRDRWIRGFVHEFMYGAWRGLPRKRRIFAAYILLTPLLQGLSFVLLPMAVVTALVTKAPIGIALCLFAPLIPMGITVLSSLIGLYQFSQEFGRRATIWHYASVLFLTPLYQFILMAAAVTAVYKYATGDTQWYKTGRANRHRIQDAQLPPRPGTAQ